MHDIRAIRDNPAAFDAALARRGLEPESPRLLALDERRRALTTSLQALQERRNAASKEVGQAKAAKDEARAQALIAEVASLKERMPQEEDELRRVEQELADALAAIPNLPLAEVPDGADEHDNVEYRRHGEPRKLNFEARQHFDLGEGLGLMDFETASKLSGARFVVLRGQLARLERALGQFMIDLHTAEHGYTEVAPPLMVRDEIMFGTAQLPKFEEDQFATRRQPLTSRYVTSDVLIPTLAEVEIKLGANAADADVVTVLGQELDAYLRRDRLWLIPTAEVPLTNLAREQILDEAELPWRFTALTHCFRAEAGAAGRDTRGMIRQHQFQKVELVSVTTPDRSREEHERMLDCAEAVLKKLGLHYRVVTLCTGDMGFASQKTYDIEVWLPGQGAYREISSCSVCGDFQARRMDARYRPKEGAPRFVHTLNGSGTAVGRAMVAVLETYQEADGSVTVPEVLRPYMGGLDRIAAPK